MGSNMRADTPAHNLTGHPAISLPAAEVSGLPSGVMFVASRFRDQELLSVARTWESNVGWQPSVPPSGRPTQSVGDDQDRVDA